MSIKEAYKEMNETLDIDDALLEQAEQQAQELSLPEIRKRRNEIKKAVYNANGELDEDYAVARETIHDLIDKGTHALNRLISLAEVDTHPRTFEVAAGMIKSLSDLSKDLIDLHTKMKKLKEEEVNQPKDEPDKIKEINPADLL